MNIGDRVRLLHGQEEGVITKISGSGRVEVEIEDGFRIPAMRNEVVVIAQAETAFFGKKEEQVPDFVPGKKEKVTSREGLVLAYLPINDDLLAVYLCNATSKSYLCYLSEQYGENAITLLAERLDAGKSLKIGEKSIKAFQEWPPMKAQFIPINYKIERALPPFERSFKFKATTFFKQKGTAPLLQKKGYVFELLQHTRELDVLALNESLQALSPTAQAPAVPKVKRPPAAVDLHIEQLVTDSAGMSNGEMLRLQLRTFEEQLNAAILSGMDEITFIHGIGNGVLRKEIHKQLGQWKGIAYFKDSQKSRFGYGATLVKITHS
ncbi:Smr protein/MutS2 [Nitritalea halalkaliphila LW7]|uniref:Smr protein/MutS2 n=1 Tax=Nitritalea halalkaliphila LW7 TaxID=1189621 RepID=I5BSP4_9BACT|nr:Smr/MutS family protein [Nitritalea halalkaliphila]EIM72596.1 Smr protein/MutS2 [Nitritalea halalkaliphila LW7]